MRWMGPALAAGVAAFVATGCATSFVGSAYFEGGRPACEAKCREQGMEAAGMVFMGEYSSACLCEVPRPNGAPPRAVSSLAGAAGGGSAGVWMQMQAAQQQHHH